MGRRKKCAWYPESPGSNYALESNFVQFRRLLWEQRFYNNWHKSSKFLPSVGLNFDAHIFPLTSNVWHRHRKLRGVGHNFNAKLAKVYVKILTSETCKWENNSLGWTKEIKKIHIGKSTFMKLKFWCKMCVSKNWPKKTDNKLSRLIDLLWSKFWPLRIEI